MMMPAPIPYRGSALHGDPVRAGGRTPVSLPGAPQPLRVPGLAEAAVVARLGSGEVPALHGQVVGENRGAVAQVPPRVLEVVDWHHALADPLRHDLHQPHG